MFQLDGNRTKKIIVEFTHPIETKNINVNDRETIQLEINLSHIVFLLLFIRIRFVSVGFRHAIGMPEQKK